MPALGGRAVVVDGLADLQRAFAVADKETSREFRDALKDAAEPVREDAERFARGRISHIGSSWSRMRIGVTRRAVYVAPRNKGTRDRAMRRKNLADLLLSKAMEPALEQNIRHVENEVEQALTKVGRKWENA